MRYLLLPSCHNQPPIVKIFYYPLKALFYLVWSPIFILICLVLLPITVGRLIKKSLVERKRLRDLRNRGIRT